MASDNPMIGKQVGNYRLGRLLGSGAFADVYLGKNEFLNSLAAIKLLKTNLADGDVEAFRSEARTLVRLIHPHILRILDAGFQNGVPYLITEYAPGGSLRDRIKKSNGKPFPFDEVINILNQIGQALHYAHEQHIIHRDLKPENILFNQAGEALLADFGIAVLLVSTHTGLVGVSGTPPYMAPEQFEGLASPKSDQYSLGCIAYELVTGHRLYTIPNPTPEAYWFHHAKVEPIPPTRFHPQLPAYIEQAILIALAKDRAQRYSDVPAFSGALLKNSKVWVDEGNAHFIAKRYEEALVAYDQTIRLDPNNSLAAVKKGVVLRELKQYEEALQAYERVLQFDPNNTDALRGKAECLRRLGRPVNDTPTKVTEPVTIQEKPGTTLIVYRGHQKKAYFAAWSPDGKYIMSQDGEGVHMWEAATGRMISKFKIFPELFSSATWSPDGRYFVSLGDVQTVRVSETATGRIILEYEGHKDQYRADYYYWVTNVAWSPDGRYIMSKDGDNTVHVWEAATGKMIIEKKHKIQNNSVDKTLHVQWSPDGRYILFRDFGIAAQVWEAATGKMIIEKKHKIQNNSVDTMLHVRWSPDGRYILFQDFGIAAQVWETATGRKKLEYKSVVAVDWSPDGRYIGFNRRNTCEVREAATGRKKLEYKDHWMGMIWSPDGRYIVSLGNDHTGHVRESATGRIILEYEVHKDHSILSLDAWSPDGRYILSEDETEIHVWEVATGRMIIVKKRKHESTSLNWSPDGKYILSKDETEIHVWEVTTGREVCEYRGHSGKVHRAYWSPDSTRIASVSSDKSVHIWKR